MVLPSVKSDVADEYIGSKCVCQNTVQLTRLTNDLLVLQKKRKPVIFLHATC